MIIKIQPAIGPTKTVVIEKKAFNVRVRGVIDSAKIIQGEPGVQGLQGEPGPIGPIGRSVTIFKQPTILTVSHIEDKGIVLSAIPDGEYMSFLPDGGIPQRVGLDFLYDHSQNKVTWSNLGLENILEIGDRVDVEFFVAQ